MLNKQIFLGRDGKTRLFNCNAMQKVKRLLFRHKNMKGGGDGVQVMCTTKGQPRTRAAYWALSWLYHEQNKQVKEG